MNNPLPDHQQFYPAGPVPVSSKEPTMHHHAATTGIRACWRLGACSALLLSFIAHVSAVVEQARPADALVEAYGVNTHLGYADTVYGRDYERVVKPKLIALGVRYIRDSATEGGEPMRRYRELAELAGIRVLMICDPRLPWLSQPTPELMARLADGAGPALWGFEGPNEFDASGRAAWSDDLRSYVRRLYRAVKDGQRTAAIPVVGPSLIQAGSYAKLGDCSDSADFSNVHHYMGGHHPGTTGWGDDNYGALEWITRVGGRRQCPDKPMFVTEYGFHSALHHRGGHVPTSENVSARYIIRQLLGNFQAGITRSYTYEFMETFSDPSLTDNESHFGMLRNDGSEKPAYLVMKEVLNELKDPGPAFSPGRLSFDLDGGSPDLRHVLLQKRNGTNYLILWLESSSWNTSRREEIIVPPQAVTVRLASSSPATVITFDGAGLVQRQAIASTGGQLRLAVTDQVTLIRLEGRVPRTAPVAQAAAAPAIRPTVDPAQREAWDVQLYERVCSEVAGRRPPRFRLTMVGAQVQVDQAGSDGDMTLSMGPSGFAYLWKHVPDADRFDLAKAMLREDQESDRALIAFYALLHGDRVAADEQLMRLGTELAAKVRVSFRQDPEVAGVPVGSQLAPSE